jgi:hypothetical protein
LVLGDPLTAVPPIVSAYVSCPLQLPPHVARAAFDSEMERINTAAGVIVGSGGRLVVRGTARVAAGVPYSPYRSQPVLVVAGWRRWPGDLELLPWSDRQTELGFAPGNAAFRRTPSDVVVSTARELLVHLARILQDWADYPLRDLTADLTTACAKQR